MLGFFIALALVLASLLAFLIGVYRAAKAFVGALLYWWA